MSECAHRLHELDGHAVIRNLAHPADGDAQMRGKVLVATPLSIQPCFEFHSVSLDCSKPKRQDIPKLNRGSLAISMDKITQYRKEKLAALIKAKPYDGNQVAFAKRVGLSKGRISQLLDPSESFGERSARAMATKLRLGERYFEEGFDTDLDASPFIEVGRVDVRLAAGAGQIADVYEEIGSLSFRRDFLASCGVTPDNAAVVNVKGTSMEPTIANGSVLLINRKNAEPFSGKIFALAKVSEGLIVKRLIKTPSGWVARSDNPDGNPDFPIDDGEPVTIIGRAVWMGSKL